MKNVSLEDFELLSTTNERLYVFVLPSPTVGIGSSISTTNGTENGSRNNNTLKDNGQYLQFVFLPLSTLEIHFWCIFSTLTHLINHQASITGECCMYCLQRKDGSICEKPTFSCVYFYIYRIFNVFLLGGIRLLEAESIRFLELKVFEFWLIKKLTNVFFMFIDFLCFVNFFSTILSLLCSSWLTAGETAFQHLVEIFQNKTSLNRRNQSANTSLLLMSSCTVEVVHVCWNTLRPHSAQSYLTFFYCSSCIPNQSYGTNVKVVQIWWTPCV